jgi:hypothetical protein
MVKISAVLVLLVAAASATNAFAQAPSFTSPVHVESSTRASVTVRLTPKYELVPVTTPDGQKRTEVRITGGQYRDTPGAPGLMEVPVSVLLPTTEPARVEIISQTLEVLTNVDLAPVPTYTKSADGQTLSYVVNEALYTSSTSHVGFTQESVSRFRSAYDQQIIFAPVQYDASSRTLTRVTDATYRIVYPTWSAEASPAMTETEKQFYSSIFVNGDRFEFYRSAAASITARIPQTFALKGAHPAAENDGIWLQAETTTEGMYRITAQELAAAGVTGAIDPNSLELLGVGGWMLDEQASDTSGEWIEHPFELRGEPGTLKDIVFYAPGITRWKYSPRQDNVDGLYHRINPYTSTGHFLLHVGGTMVGTPIHVGLAPDQLIATPTEQDHVFSSVTYEEESNFEVPNYGRELVGKGIPHSDVGMPLTFSVDAPGYVGDSTTVRVGFDALVPSSSSGFVTVRAGGQEIGRIQARNTQSEIIGNRNWNNALHIPANVSAPVNLSLDFTSDNTTSHASLDWIELMYKRSTSVGSTSISFMVIDTKDAYHYTFSDATGGEIWDVTRLATPRAVAVASGSTLDVSLQGVADTMRRFFAFSEASLSASKLARVSAPRLRSTVGLQGSQSIIIAPAAFRQAADSLAHIRQMGGQATEPLTVSVVNLEDVFEEFGYGSRDLTAVRDFLSYTFRHTLKNGTTVPLYVTLMGAGHSDYQNRVTKVANWMPVWESESNSGEYLGNYREIVQDAYPDDAFFAQVIPHNSPRQLDFAIGRVSARSLQEALTYAGKVQKYEHSSAEGDWRSVVSFVADDRVADEPDRRDGIDHFSDTEEEVRRVQNRLLINKVYGVSYATSYTATGRRKPTMEAAILDAVNGGSVLLSFVGHGNPHVWTHEAVLTVPGTINRFTNIDKLAYMTTATCDFSQYDDYEDESGGVMMLMRPEGGAIGLLGTSRSVTGQENLVFTFYSALFGVDPSSGFGTAAVGSAYLAGKLVSYSENVHYYYLLGDPSQRLLVPRYYVAFDSINGAPSNAHMLPALSPVRITGHIVRDTGANATALTDFNGTVTLTLYDSPNQIASTSTFPNEQIVDRYQIEGPILYRGTATVKNGVFSSSFIVPKDVKFDTVSAKITALAYGDYGRSALGATRNLQLTAPDSINSIVDNVGPRLQPFIGSRGFRSGDDVAMESKLIVDVEDEHGLNTSTASIGHSFIAWVDDDMSSAIDLAPGYVADQDNFQRGTSIDPAKLPAGHHTLHVRAFDTFDNPGFAEVDFVAKKDAPFRLYEVVNQPNPIVDRTVFRFTQPSTGGSPVDVTLALYTSDGRLVRTLHARSAESVIELDWDSRDEGGNRVANGAYAFHLNVENSANGTSSQADGLCVVSH